MKKKHQLFYLLGLIFWMQACIDDLEPIHTDTDNTEILALQGHAFYGFLNGVAFGSNEIVVRIVEDELHILLKPTERIFPLLHEVPQASTCNVYDEFYVRISDFSGLGQYQAENLSEDLDTNNVFQWEHCIDPKHCRDTRYRIVEVSDYFSVHIEYLDIENARIRGKIFTRLSPVFDELELDIKEIQLNATFDTRLEYPTVIAPQLPSQDTCTFSGYFYNDNFCIDRMDITYAPERGLKINAWGEFPAPEWAQSISICEAGYFLIYLGDFKGSGIYPLTYGHDNAPNAWEASQCFQQDIFLINYRTYRVTDYFILQVDYFDLENQKISGKCFADVSSGSLPYPAELIGFFNTSFSIE